jgi:hypothetical protein
MTSPEPTLEGRVRAIVESLERARFAGASPRVEAAADASADEVAARVLAAERLGLPLVLGEQTHHLHEQRAWEGLWAAQDAVGRWSFGEADARLDRASAVAVDPALQQRLGLWKLFSALARRLIRAHPEETLRGDPARPALDLLAAADRLSEAERSHYRAEVERLVGVHAAARAGADSVERALWYVVRARLTLAADEPLAALAWCVRLGRLQADRLPADPYLTGLLEKARTYVLLVLGELDASAGPSRAGLSFGSQAPAEREYRSAERHRSGSAPTAGQVEAAAAARDATRNLRAWDVYRALLAHLGPALGVDLQRESARFTITPYRDADA